MTDNYTVLKNDPITGSIMLVTVSVAITCSVLQFWMPRIVAAMLPPLLAFGTWLLVKSEYEIVKVT